MKRLKTRKYSVLTQFLVSILLVLFVALACYFTSAFIGYRVIALILLMTASLIAMLFDIAAVVTAAVLSALIWNFFFIPPLYTFHIDNAEDALMFLLYFVIALVNAVLIFKIREAEQKARDKEEKEHTIKLYNTLLNSLSHELRTPIATIIGSVDTLKEGKNALSLLQQNELIAEIGKAATRLNRQVENLLNMGRLESGMLKPRYDWCDLNELIHAVIQKFDLEQQQQIIFKQHDQLPLFKLDGGLLEQVLHNLLHNAIQYTLPSTAIEIEAVHHGGGCLITVSDAGSGFPSSEIDLVFDKFYRLSNAIPGGSGLGLSIVKGFVEAMHGSITLENRKEGGAKFSIAIPAEVSFLNNLKNE